jgi:hypothetical protein
MDLTPNATESSTCIASFGLDLLPTAANTGWNPMRFQPLGFNGD